MIKVTKEQFEQFLKDRPGGTYEIIRWSTPRRYNFFHNNKMIAYYYDKYENCPEEYFIP